METFIVLLWIILALVLIGLLISVLRKWRLARTILSIACVVVLVWLVLVYSSVYLKKRETMPSAKTLAGMWQATRETLDGTRFDITTNIEPDGEIIWTGTVQNDGRTMGIDSSGTWKLQNRKFIYTIDISNFNPYFPVEHAETVTVQKVGPRELVYTRSDGTQFTETRVTEE